MSNATGAQPPKQPQTHARAVIGFRLMLAAVGVLLLLPLGACRVQPGTGAAAPPVHDLRVLTSPAPVAMERGSRPDGLWVHIYALTQGQSRAVNLPPGRLDLLLYDGAARPPADASESPDREPYLRFQHASAELSGAAMQTVAGPRYTLPVRWGSQEPASGVVTLLVRFVPDHGRPVYSPPVSIRLRPG